MIWHDDVDFWGDFGRLVIFTPRRHRSAIIESRLLSMVLPRRASGLDMCCGLGWHALELSRHGFRITGVDLNGRFLGQARKTAKEQKLSAKFVKGDMRTFSSPVALDFVLSLSTSFGFFQNRLDDLRTARNFHAALKPGGTLIMDLMGREIFERRFVPRNRVAIRNAVISVERAFDKRQSWVEEVWTFAEHAVRKEYRVSYRVYSARELAALLRRVGFSSIEAWGDLSGSPYGESARRLVIRASRNE